MPKKGTTNYTDKDLSFSGIEIETGKGKLVLSGYALDYNKVDIITEIRRQLNELERIYDDKENN